MHYFQFCLRKTKINLSWTILIYTAVWINRSTDSIGCDKHIANYQLRTSVGAIVNTGGSVGDGSPTLESALK